MALLVDRDPPIEMFLAPVSDPLMVQASSDGLTSRVVPCRAVSCLKHKEGCSVEVCVQRRRATVSIIQPCVFFFLYGSFLFLLKVKVASVFCAAMHG